MRSIRIEFKIDGETMDFGIETYREYSYQHLIEELLKEVEKYPNTPEQINEYGEKIPKSLKFIEFFSIKT